MKTISSKIILLILIALTSTFLYGQPPSWSWTNSLLNHSVGVTNNSVFINGNPAPVNDSWIGVFYTDSYGELQCAGYKKWNGVMTLIPSQGENAYGDDGFKTGEEFIFKIFVADGQDSLIYDAEPFFDSFSSFLTAYDSYSTNGLSLVVTLHSCQLSTTETQILNLPQNWSIVSTYLDPLQKDIDSIFNPVISNLIIIKDGYGLIYWPQFGVNAIDTISPGWGYQIKMLANDNLEIEGTFVNTDIFQLIIPSGWSIIGHLKDVQVPVEEAYSSLIENVVIVKDYIGNVWWPFFGLNQIGNVTPGLGYLIKIQQQDTLIYNNTYQNQNIACPQIVFDVNGNSYNTVLIGNQCWMAENLRATHYANGSPIPNISSNTDWDSLNISDKAWCNYDNSLAYGNMYGKLYTWAAAVNYQPNAQSNPGYVQGICPNGWVVPQVKDWEVLSNYISQGNGTYDRDYWFWKGVGGNLKSNSGWYYGGNGIDNYGFTGMPGGVRSINGDFQSIDKAGYWWSASESDSMRADTRKLFYYNQNFFNFKKDKNNGFSVRCLLDTCTQFPTMANAGSDMFNLTSYQVNLQANTPVIGNGSWSVVEGIGGIFSNVSNPNSTFHATESIYYELVWTISNACGIYYDTVEVSFICQDPPTQANAGPDQLNLTDTLTNLQANTPTEGTGTWSLASGAGGHLSDIHDPHSQFIGSPLNEYTLVWTIGNMCYETHDTVTISFSCGLAPTQAYAGPDQTNITDTATTLQGNTPTSGSGAWWIVAGTGGTVIDPLSPTSQFVGVPGNEYTITWSISNLCGSSVDTVLIELSCGPQITQALAGADQINLVDTFATLAANIPIVGAGQWRLLSGSGGSFSNDSLPSTQFHGFAGNQYQLTWTITGLCEQSTDTVLISFQADSTFYCGNTMLYDIDGNYYPTVQIGNQCWMARNLAATKYPNGDSIPHITNPATWWGLGEADKAYTYLSNMSSYAGTRGALYTWATATNNVNSSSAPSGVQGICPTGWHIPSVAEWDSLASFIANDNGGAANGYVFSSYYWRWSNLGQFLKSTNGWSNGGTDNYGFNAVPSGNISYGNFAGGLNNFFWSSDTYSETKGNFQYLNNGPDFGTGANSKHDGMSVRCLKD